MLFSREDVAAFINQHFEPAWEMVRPVPILRIDFGNGNVSTRTLHGNVASYVCCADGQVVDILPGIYTPAEYMAALIQPRDMARDLRRLAPEQRLSALQQHHQLIAATRRLNQAQQGNNPQLPRVDVGKGRIELPVERAVVPPRVNRPNAQARPRNAAELAAWQPLIDDTIVNETQRRLQIHDRLGRADATRPENIVRWLYRDVLHADLDDPYLGLGDDFFRDIERQ